MVAAVGLAAGGGMYLVALAATLVALFGLTLLRRVEGKQWRLLQRRVVIASQNGSPGRREVIEEVQRIRATVTDVDYDRNIGSNESTLELNVRFPNEQVLEQMLTRLEQLPNVQRPST